MRKLLQRVLGGVSIVAVGLMGMTTVASAQETGFLFYGVKLKESEYRYRIGDESDLVTWSGDAFIGTDEWKLRLQSEGARVLRSNSFERLEHQLTLQTPISTFFDAKAGIRLDTPKGTDRVHGVLGLHGLAPQWFEVDADLFLSEKGDLSARLDLDYELLITNRLILTPSAEVNFGFSTDAAVGQGAGLRDLELGLRLSYDLVDRSIAPYVGVSYERAFGRTARFKREEGEHAGELFLVGGVRFMF